MRAKPALTPVRGGNRPFWVAALARGLACDIVREYVVENLATVDAVLVSDETGFLKQARRRAALHVKIQVRQVR